MGRARTVDLGGRSFRSTRHLQPVSTAAQIVGRCFDAPTVLRTGAAVEKLRPWRQWTPGDLGGTGD